ncbi:hypothetical protein C8N32_103143 [Rhodovulum imhoffii]|uniref:Uncharacterized protein n=1 Tax=Rhodovulum imhoffii TaxID=365340 RepID=A0A2T5BUV4_9RHOB|nr:DciA family protein [Rhodovulum imhoffii]MBK5934899.1 RNA-binding protein [Rhodovulum imhoffii]PTN03300.1 hypothetical protein C8N32_103143 [Rhodovulum imhoffii]
MTGTSTVSKAATRRGRGFERASVLLQPRIRKVGETRGFAESRLLTHWPEIVGPEIAATCRPVEIRYGRKGFGATLTLLTTGALAPVLEMRKEAVREQVNACYGYAAIARIHLTQTASTGFAEGQVQFAPRSRAPATPDPGTAVRAEKLSADVQDESLRTALERLARNVLSRPKAKET